MMTGKKPTIAVSPFVKLNASRNRSSCFERPVSPDKNVLATKLIGLMWLRLLLVVVFLGTTIWVQINSEQTYSQRSLLLLYGIIISTLILTVIYAFLLKRIKNFRRFAYLQLTGDVLLITLTVYATSGIGSIFSFLYFFSIISGSILLNRKGGFVVAALSSLSYGTLVDLEFYRIMPNITAHISYEVTDVFYTLYVNVIAFFTVAFLSGSLAEKITAAEKELDARTKDFIKLEDINKNIVDNISSGILTLDHEGKINSFNKAAEDHTGYSTKEVTNSKVSDLFPNFSFTSRGSRGELIFEKKDGTVLIFGFSSSPLNDEKGKEIGHIVIFQDLTRLKEMEDELRRADRLKALGGLAAGMAHEIRNPLASISGSIQVLRDDLELSCDDKHLMDIILRETERLNALVTDFLVFAKPATKKEKICLEEIIEETLKLVETQSEMQGVSICRKFHDRTIIYADPKQIKQVFLNFFLNALEAMVNGGELSISINNDSTDYNQKREEVACEIMKEVSSNEKTYAVVTISDTGIGIDEGDIDKIFDPFFTTRDQGTGLGLAVVYRIIESHGGFIDVKSAEGKGTTFLIFLPTAEKQPDLVNQKPMVYEHLN